MEEAGEREEKEEFSVRGGREVSRAGVQEQEQKQAGEKGKVVKDDEIKN